MTLPNLFRLNNYNFEYISQAKRKTYPLLTGILLEAKNLLVAAMAENAKQSLSGVAHLVLAKCDGGATDKTWHKHYTKNKAHAAP